MATEELSLGDFVKQLAVSMGAAGLVMLFRQDKPWHMLFYDLKKDREAKGRPKFLDDLRFDWDGPYPKSRELAEFIQALHWTGSLGAVNPSYDELVLQPEVSALWSGYRSALSSDTQTYLAHAVEVAKKEFPPKQA